MGIGTSNFRGGAVAIAKNAELGILALFFVVDSERAGFGEAGMGVCGSRAVPVAEQTQPKTADPRTDFASGP